MLQASRLVEMLRVGYRRGQVAFGNGLCRVSQQMQGAQVEANNDVKDVEQQEDGDHAPREQNPLHAAILFIDVIDGRHGNDTEGTFADGLREDAYLTIVVLHLAIAAGTACDVAVELAAVAARNVKLGMGERLLYLGQQAVLLNKPLDARTVHTQPLVLLAGRHLRLA